MDVIIKGWEIKFEQISRCLREVQLASEKANSDMFSITRDGRARENHRQRRQGHRPDYVRISISNHLLSARTSQLNPRAARIRASGITTTLGTRAPGITTTLGTRAPGITTTLGTRAPGITTTLGTRAPGITTTLGTRASEITTTLEICAATTFTTLEIGAGITDPTNGLHMRMIGEIAVTCSETHTIVG